MILDLNDNAQIVIFEEPSKEGDVCLRQLNLTNTQTNLDRGGLNLIIFHVVGVVK